MAKLNHMAEVKKFSNMKAKVCKRLTSEEGNECQPWKK